MSDHERIWLQNADDARATGDRLWCQDKVWPECDEQQEPTEYIRVDLYASRISQQDAELERMRRELDEAREALKPFADEAACYDPDEGDGDDNVWATPVYFKIRDLRNARALRAKAEETRT